MKNKTSYFKIIAGTVSCSDWGKMIPCGGRFVLIGHF